MVNEEDRVKVADFGLARPMTGEAEENPFGTPDYAAPEIMDKRGVDQRADIFAAGVVLYELLTGRVPATPRRSVTEYSPVHKRWDEIIAKATDPDPDKRYPDALEFRAHIAAALTIGTNASAVVTETKPVAKEPEPSAPKPAAKPSPLPKIAMAAAAVIMVLFVVLLKPSGEPEKAVEAEKPAPKLEKPAEEPKKVAEAPPVEKPAKVEKAPEPPMKVEEPKKVVVVEPAPAMAATKPEPTPPPAPAPAPTSAELLAKLESSDPELTQILVGITAAWDANPEANPGPAKKDLAFKYIPYLQKSLPTTPPAQRDPILSEISNVANNQPLLPVEESWPAALKQLRQTYDTQISAITSKADAASKALLQSQQASLLQLAKDRAAKGDAAGAKRAELIATALLQITGRPTIEALKETGGKL
jgi:serine/threonine protein kinase